MKKVETITIGKETSFVLAFQTLILLAIGVAIFSKTTGSTNGSIPFTAWGIPVYFATLIAHELFHGIGFKLSGAKPYYGVGMAGFMPVAYATSKDKVSLRGMLLAAYLPFVGLSVITVAIARMYPPYQPYALIAFLGNFTGAVGDMWIAARLWKYVHIPDIRIRDTKHGLLVYSDSAKALVLGKRAMKRRNAKDNFYRYWGLSAVVLLVVALIAPGILNMIGFTGDFVLGTQDIYLFKSHNPVSTGSTASVSAEISFVIPVLAGLFIAVAIKMLNRKPNR